jgi:hypothetical protein
MLKFVLVANEVVWSSMPRWLTKPFAMLIIPFLNICNHGKRLPNYDFGLEWCKDPKPTMMPSLTLQAKCHVLKGKYVMWHG